jgi:hypothetical protein
MNPRHTQILWTVLLAINFAVGFAIFRMLWEASH